jgi:hypothetical protein
MGELIAFVTDTLRPNHFQPVASGSGEREDPRPCGRQLDSYLLRRVDSDGDKAIMAKESLLNLYGCDRGCRRPTGSQRLVHDKRRVTERTVAIAGRSTGKSWTASGTGIT